MFCKKSCGECPGGFIAGRSFSSGHGRVNCDDSKKYAGRCKSWANHGECTKSQKFMKKYCKKSCDLCTVKHCDDSKKYSFKCPTWANFGECHKRPNFMKKYCKKSCNLCTVKPTTPTTTSTTKATGIVCKDKLDTCVAWKKEGECTKVESQTFITKYCKKTCNKCDEPTTTSKPTTKGISSKRNCKDKLDTCPAWKKEGECTKVESQTFMTKYCKKSCNKCDDVKTTTPTTTHTTKTTDECKDSEELASKCPVWKKQGECHKEESQKFMKKYCAKTCDKCDDKCKDSEELASKCHVWKKQGECDKVESKKFMKKYCAKTCDKCSDCHDVLP